MKVVNIQEAKTHLSRLVEEAVAGQGIVVAKAGKPMVQLVPVGGAGTIRPLGLLAARQKRVRIVGMTTRKSPVGSTRGKRQLVSRDRIFAAYAVMVLVA